MAELSGNWWKKNKPKTLSDEPLTAAFVVYDKAEAARKKEAIQDNYENVRQALASGLKPAVAATQKKCNAVLHKQTIKNLEELSKNIDKELKIIADHYASMRAIKGNITKLYGAYADTFKKFTSSMSHSDYKSCEKTLDSLKDAVENMANQHDFYSPYQGQLHQKVLGVRTTMANFDKSFDQVFGPNADPANAKKAPLILAELGKGPANIGQWLNKMA